MRRFPLALLLLLAACGGSETPAPTDPAPPDAPTPAAEAAGAVVPAAAPSAGTATVTFRGPDVDVSGDYPARYCGGPAYLPPAPPQGVMYEVTFEGHTLSVSDTEARRPGEHALVGGGWNVLLNGGSTSYLPSSDAPGTLTVSDDFRTADVRGAMEVAASPDTARYALEVAFHCN